MEIVIQRRAIIALRSLEQQEQKQVKRAVEVLESLTQEDVYKFPKLNQSTSDLSRLKPKSPRLKNNLPKPPKKAGKFLNQNQFKYFADKNYYLYQINSELRLILSIANCKCIVEDIMADEKLKRLVANLKQQ